MTKNMINAHDKEKHRDDHFMLRVIMMTIAALVFAYSCTVLILGIDISTLNYRESGSVNYEVCLKPNDYFADSCQSEGKQYVASLIDNLEAKFIYDFQTDEAVTYDYTYDISAKLVATEAGDDGRVLYENDDVIVPSRTLDGESGQSLVIRENVEIDYDKYNDLIMAFRSDYGLTIESSVTVILNVAVRAVNDNFSEPIKTNQKIALKIPLSERTINVVVESDKLNNSGSIEQKVYNFDKNMIFVIMAGVSGVMFVAVLVVSIVIFIWRRSRRTDYEKTLGRILHEYNQLIVEVERMPKVPRNKVVEVTDFDELLNAHDTIGQPILHMVGEDDSLFAIEGQDIVYTYVLSAKSLGRKDKGRAKESG
jgi:hypothetical protein